MWLFCFIVAYVIVRAWEQARAQTGAEWRRAREHVTGEFGRRMAAGEVSSPWDDPWWWAAAARRAWRAMHGPRQGARNTALPGRSPWRRIMQAAQAGAARGAAQGARRAADRRQARRAARAAAGGGRGMRGARRAARAAGFGAGWAAGRAGWRRAWRQVFVPVGVCDNCGTVAALPAMAYQRVDVDGRTETWLLCAACRAATGGPDPDPGRQPVTAGPQGAPPATGHPSDGPLAVGAADPAADPGGALDPGPETGPSGPAEPGPPQADAGSGPESVTDVPRGELAAGTSQEISTSTDGGHMSTEIELAGGRLPGRAGESYSYGSWARETASDAELLDQLGLALEAMLANLTAVAAGRTQVANVTAWADRVGAEAGLTREAIDEMDRRYRPVIGAVDGAGGTEEVCNTSYYAEI